MTKSFAKAHDEPELAAEGPSIREANVTAFLDAAERLLIREGAAGISTRQLAREAGQNHGLVHYYFGSVDELLLQTLERFTARILERQRAMYETKQPFIEKWRTAMAFIDEDLASGYPKIWAELQALAWNRPELRERVQGVADSWRTVLRDALAEAIEEYDLVDSPFSAESWAALVAQFNQGLLLERLFGFDRGHEALLAAIDAWLSSLEKRKTGNNNKTSPQSTNRRKAR
ncbi:MAG TPA: TetR family transcriptional regulator [Solirubrobacteraceae bacterium]|nr:TetR family transcriptional regulator [Solirubrobacteraceae bacterium]